MSTRTPVVPAIQWHEGMLLSPQHFQQADLRQQQILSYHLRRMSPYHWGIHHMKLDPIVIPAGIIRIQEIEAIFPDGLIVSRYDDMGHLPLEINLGNQKQEVADKGLFIYLCVPEQGPGSLVSGDWPRYDSVEGSEVVDDNAIDNIITIPRLEPKLLLIAAAYPPARYASIPIAYVGYEDEAYYLKSFIAPCFMVSSTSPLGEICSHLAQHIREKVSYLTEKFQKQIGSTMMRETGDQLRPLIQSLPLLEPLLQQSKPHPHTLYLKVCEVAGHFASLRIGVIPPIFPAYHHEHIYSSFSPVIDWIQEILATINRKVSIFSLHHQDRLFFIKLNPLYLYGDALLLGVRGAAGMSREEVAEWMKESVIATESCVETARMRRITGAYRELVQYEELADLMPSQEVEVYRVTVDPEFIKLDETLMIFHAADSPDKRPVDIVMYVKGDQTQELGEEDVDE